MSSVICFNLDKSKTLLSGNGLNHFMFSRAKLSFYIVREIQYDTLYPPLFCTPPGEVNALFEKVVVSMGCVKLVSNICVFFFQFNAILKDKII